VRFADSAICTSPLDVADQNQGGESDMTGTTTDTVTLPISFPSGVLMAIPVDVLLNGSPVIMGRYYVDGVTFIGNLSAGAYTWVAIGH